ncbi:hypothetical protein [Nocardia sienata]|uniref:hypothetical protein n=1 Tax=Nocardia sienata TaxID=248552 RepID=UPI0007A4F46C|nr:hypothetical protein [Nocardia sienata]
MRGEADAFTLGLWQRSVREALAVVAPGGTLVLDASRLDFLSLDTLAAVADMAEACSGDGTTLCLITRNPRIPALASRHPRTAGLPIFSTVVGALAALPPAVDQR